jgi:recombination protein RecA
MSKKQRRQKNRQTTKKKKLKALQLTVEKLDKAYGKGSVMKLGRFQNNCRGSNFHR